MAVIFAETAFLADGWARDVRVELGTDGRIAAVTPGAAAQPGDTRVGVLLPGMPNLHSHAFQRGMAGLAERRGLQADSFWTWRETMYRFALAITPDETEAVASQLYMEMLEAGFTRVGEFHYVHHDRDGSPYADLGELAGRIVAAAAATGIGLTLLPVFYARAGFGGAEPAAEQRRFITDRDRYAALLARCRAIVGSLPGGVVGVAPHSLRAVTPDELAAAVALAGEGPIHIHIAEQVREVEDCVAWSGARPVEWLLDHAAVDARWCLIHATHMTDAEVRGVAARAAVAGLCPITEANLGDGTFAAAAFRASGGRFGIGTDSNVAIGVADELRQLEYSQRLAGRARNVLADQGGSTGRALFAAALAGGAQALGAGPPAIAAGAPADLVSLDSHADALVGRSGDAVLDAWIFGGGRPVDGVWVGGRQVVSGGRHHGRDRIAPRFGAAMRRLATAEGS